MFIPPVLPGMKQPDERAAFRVNSAQVRSLVRIAVVAGESEVSAVVCSAMLASDHVLDVIGEERLRVLWQGAVFAAISLGSVRRGLSLRCWCALSGARGELLAASGRLQATQSCASSSAKAIRGGRVIFLLRSGSYSDAGGR